MQARRNRKKSNYERDGRQMRSKQRNKKKSQISSTTYKEDNQMKKKEDIEKEYSEDLRGTDIIIRGREKGDEHYVNVRKNGVRRQKGKGKGIKQKRKKAK